MSQARRYRLLSVLGQGGFGTVYRARLLGEEGFSKPVALKVLNPEVAEVRELARRLRDEARVLGLVQHRAIVKVDALVQLDGRWTVVMEYVEGRDLKTILEKGPIPLGPALEIITEVVSALHAAYNATGPDDTPLRLLHRDIKPANLCVTALGEVKVLDFGIARAEFGDRESNTQSQAYGTPDYMAPERFLFENGPEADLYAVGATLYEMLLGEQLGRASPRESMHAELIEARLTRLSGALGPAHGDVIALLHEVLDYDPARRPVARELERRLTRLRHGKEGPLLRDWAESALPLLVAAQESRVDGSTGTLLVEGEASRDEPPRARDAWPGPLTEPAESATFAIPAPPGSGETLVAEPEDDHASALTPPATPPATPPVVSPVVSSDRRLLAVAALIALAVGLLLVFRPSPGPTPPPPALPSPTEARPSEPAPAEPAPAEPAPAEPAPAPEVAAAPVAAPEVAASSTSKSSVSSKVQASSSPAPAPSTATAPPPESSPQAATASSPAASSPAAGTWEGSMNGRPMDLTLRARGGALGGEVVVSFGPSSVSSKVRGTWDEQSRTLQLEDEEQTEDAGTYTATLTPDGARMSGSFHANSGGTVVRFTLTRK